MTTREREREREKQSSHVREQDACMVHGIVATVVDRKARFRMKLF